MTGNSIDGSAGRSRFFYGWIVVAAGLSAMAANSAAIYSFGVFFKPLAASFGWDRATTSGVQSLFWVAFAASAIGAGWLADRFGPAKILGMCGSIAGIGLILTSRTAALWQIYLTYSLLTGAGLAVTFPISGTIASRWFSNRRGMALGLVAAGTGVGNLVGVPAVASLIENLGWSQAYLILGVGLWVVMVGCAVLMGRGPAKTTVAAGTGAAQAGKAVGKAKPDFTLRQALRSKTLWVTFSIFVLFSFCIQMVMAHVVNYATDIGVPLLVAATLISVIGVGSVTGRILMGVASDRIGPITALIICCTVMASSLVWLIFSRDLWMLYLFAITFGFCYGGEIPQQPALIARFFGLRVMLVGIVHGGATVGGAIGSWVGGQIFDVTRSYQVAFLIAAGAITCAFVSVLIVARQK